MRYVTFQIPEPAFRRMFMPLIRKEVAALIAEHRRRLARKRTRKKSRV